MVDTSKEIGFTLIELIIVMVILGALAAVTAPVYFSKQGYLERGYFDKVLQAARYAQKYAVVSNCNVAFVTSDGGYTIQSLAAPPHNAHCSASSNPMVELPGISQQSTPPSGTTVTTATVIFSPKGAANQSIVISIGGEQMRIHQTTGYVERL